MKKTNEVAKKLEKYKKHIGFCFNRLLLPRLNLFPENQKDAFDQLIIFWVLQKTARFGFLDFTQKHLLSSSKQYHLPSISDCLPVATFYRHFWGLVRCGIFLEQKGYYPKEYIVNLPLMLRKIATMVPCTFDDESKVVSKNDAYSIHSCLKLSEDINKIINGEFETMPDMKEAVETGREKSKKAHATKVAKKINKSEWTPTKLYLVMKELCEEYSAPFNPSAWTNKTKGCAKNWIKQCEDGGVDIQDRIRDICSRWYEFRAGKLVTRAEGKKWSGSEIRLSEAVSFQEFYVYKAEIEDWIVINKNNIPKKDDTEIVYLHVVDGRIVKNENRIGGI